MRALLLLVTACWSSSQPATPPTPPAEPPAPSSAFRVRPPTNACRRTIDNMAEKLRPEFSKTGIPETTIDEMIEAAVDSCRAMDWSTELIGCYEGAGDSSELNNCQAMMTSEQTEDFTRRLMDVISRMNQLSPPPSP